MKSPCILQILRRVSRRYLAAQFGLTPHLLLIAKAHSRAFSCFRSLFFYVWILSLLLLYNPCYSIRARYCSEERSVSSSLGSEISIRKSQPADSAPWLSDEGFLRTASLTAVIFPETGA